MLDRLERAEELVRSYEKVGWDRLCPKQRATLQVLRWVTLRSMTEPKEIAPEDYA